MLVHLGVPFCWRLQSSQSSIGLCTKRRECLTAHLCSFNLWETYCKWRSCRPKHMNTSVIPVMWKVAGLLRTNVYKSPSSTGLLTRDSRVTSQSFSTPLGVCWHFPASKAGMLQVKKRVAFVRPVGQRMDVWALKAVPVNWIRLKQLRNVKRPHICCVGLYMATISLIQ